MTYNDLAYKPDNDHLSPQLTAFLNALYRDAETTLWLELRCIDPTSVKKPKVLWMPVGKREAMLGQAEKLNHGGYSIYFAPCLRKTRKGTAEAAALLPALWADIDCDDDPIRRTTALDRLNTFDPLPSAIFDSGGGWHAYWLLAEPLILDTDDARQQATVILRGLFAVLGGDPEYVKSVASIMRLPGSINTKPERGGAIMSAVELNLDRRYALANFEWLAVPQESPGSAAQIAVSANGHHPLPRRILEYLSQGAAKGSRNELLFDAACQFRDAGYSQSEAEAELIPRYVADGDGENPTAREREARASIASAYRRTARDPIPAGDGQAGREKVEALSRRYQAANPEQRQPTHSEITDAVQACASLNPIEWAEQRQRLKVLCGGGLRLTDLDRLYRQARRDLERSARQTMPETEDYAEVDGRMVFRRGVGERVSEQTIATWTGHIVERVSQVNDDGQAEHITILDLHGQQTMRLSVPSETFGDDAALRRFIAGKAGEEFTVRAGMGKHLAPAILSLSGAYPRRTNYRFMGWTELDGKLTYIAPGVCVNRDGVVSTPPGVELETRLRDFALRWPENAEWPDTLKALQAMVAVFPKAIAPVCIAFTLLPVVQRFFPAAAPKPALHLFGTYQSGKSELAALMSSFYGAFTRDEPPAQWGDTINTVEMLGYPLADTLYWVDDYKNVYADERTFTRFLQSYSRGMGRGRLNRELKLRQERPCRGLLLSTGETVLEGEASVLSRMLVLEVPPWEQRDPQGQALRQAEQLRHLLPGFTARFAAWVARQVEQGDFERKLAEGFAASAEGYRKKLTASSGRQSNIGRLVQNWSVLVTTFRTVYEFLMAEDKEDLLPGWQDVAEQTVRAVRQERASQTFLNILAQLIAGGQVVLDREMQTPPNPGVMLIGYRDDEYAYILPEIAHREVSRVQPMHFNTVAVGMQLREDDYLIPGKDNLTVQRRIRGNLTRVWRIRASALGCDTCDTCDRVVDMHAKADR
jgi:Primase C terminal 1 (PriCT-1)